MSLGARRFFLKAAPLALMGASLPGVAQAQEFCQNDSIPLESFEGTDVQDFRNGDSQYVRNCPENSLLCGTNRKLPLSEKGFLSQFFGDQLKTGKMRLFYAGESDDFGGMELGRNNFVIFGQNIALSDYSVDLFNPEHIRRLREDYYYREAIKTFLHEVLHVWQRQQRYMFTRDLPNAALSDNIDDPDCSDYAYRVIPTVPRTPFSLYTLQQQASMLENYFVAVFVGREFIDENFRNREAPGAVEEMIAIVETQFPEARRTRLAFEASGLHIRPAASDAPQPIQQDMPKEFITETPRLPPEIPPPPPEVPPPPPPVEPPLISVPELPPQPEPVLPIVEMSLTPEPKPGPRPPYTLSTVTVQFAPSRLTPR